MLKTALAISGLSWAYDTFLYIFGFERGSVLQLLTLVLHVALFPLSYFIFPQITILSGLIPFAFYYLPPLWRYRSSDTTQDVAHPTLDDISDAIGLKAQPRTFSMQEMVNARRNTTLSVIVAIHAAMMHLLTLVVASVVSLIVLTPWIASTIVRAVLFGIALVAAATCCAARLLLEPTLFRLRSPLSPTLRAAISWVHTSLQYPVMLLTVCFITSYPVDPGVLSLVSYFFLSSHATFALTSPALALASAAPLLVPWGYTAPLALVLRLVLPRVSRVVRSVVLHAYYTVEPVAGNSKPAWRYICLAYVLLTLPLQLLGHVVAGVLGLDMFPPQGHARPAAHVPRGRRQAACLGRVRPHAPGVDVCRALGVPRQHRRRGHHSHPRPRAPRPHDVRGPAGRLYGLLARPRPAVPPRHDRPRGRADTAAGAPALAPALPAAQPARARARRDQLPQQRDHAAGRTDGRQAAGAADRRRVPRRRRLVHVVLVVGL
ncbi:hypothetical protein J8273_3511 [Carpediemonas membranifera]|uniref:Uncharacterized protein n=1 Tax=Carpediemonas membranifera TaxID=201153 RepID=A0A8J6AWJ7_9EUKA|nr:hypothetical protein J8273_3511 [Carpediemonas membranifera]|eukprot:KAG9393375.1 hypothetical protein J8273_3511 [Carpediemonas membranifera]